MHWRATWAARFPSSAMRDSSSRTATDRRPRDAGGLTALAALDHHILVRTDTPGARRAVESLFRNMRAPVRGTGPEQLELRRVQTGWTVSGGSGDEMFCRSL